MRSGHHYLHDTDPARVAASARREAGYPRRGAGDSQFRYTPEPGGEGTPAPGAYRPDRNSGREPPLRSMVDLRLPQPRSAGRRSGIRPIRQANGVDDGYDGRV